MSKVVHLSDPHHTRIRRFCQRHSLKMSEWVGSLAEATIEAIERDESPAPDVQETQEHSHAAVAAGDDDAHDGSDLVAQAKDAAKSAGRAMMVPKKKLGEPAGEHVEQEDASLPAYAAPPFWDNRPGS